MIEQDLILLNSYLDGQLPGGERDALEARLAREPQLKAELDSLQDTIRLLKMAERVPVPRNFTLDPAKYAKPARQSWLDALTRNSPLVVAGAMVVASLVFIGGAVVLLSPGSRGGASVAMESAPAAQAPAEGQTLNFAAKSTESAADAMTEAPSLAGGAPAPMVPLPTQASAGGPEVTIITQEALPSLDAGQRGMGGGGGGPGGAGGAPAVPPAATEQYNAAGAENASEAASSGLSSYTATEDAEATRVAKADVREADPFGTLNRTGLILAIAIGVMAVLLTMAVVLVRRRQS